MYTNSRSSSSPSRFRRSTRFGNNRRVSTRGVQRRKPEAFDIAGIIRKSKIAQEASPSPRDEEADVSFADFAFHSALAHNLKNNHFTKPTPIQARAIPHILAGKDVVGLAQTGTGKTAAFLLPIIEHIFQGRVRHTLIITPTRELALQIETAFRQFTSGMRLFSVACIGGAALFQQVRALKRHPHVVIGTPGRLIDLMDRGDLSLTEFNSVVIDEIDRMLDMGFIDPIKMILNRLPKERQSLFFSATMPPRIRELVKTFLHDPITVEVHAGTTTHLVDQHVVKTHSREKKFEQLAEILLRPEMKKVLIFNETKRGVEQLTRQLVAAGFKAESIHGDKRQSQRQRSLTQFRKNSITILVATDVAARGLDIDDVSHVVNYTAPQSYDDYIHRIGRTGRKQRKGTALTFVE